MNEEIKKVISEEYKPVSYVRFEEDWTKDRQSSGEYSVKYYPLIMSREKEFFGENRATYTCFIKFEDNTGFKLSFEPKDYLGRLHQYEGKIDEGCGCKSAYVSHGRNIDINKVLNRILKTLKDGEIYENPSLELLDLMTN